MLQTTQMECSDVRRLLPEYLNGTLDVRRAQLMRWHFGHCKNCRIIVHTAIETFRESFPDDRFSTRSRKPRAA